MLTATFACHDALNNLLPAEKREIVSSFQCSEEPYVIGVWVKGEEKQVVPLYLTREQLDNLNQE